MDHIRIKISVHLNQNHALSEKDLKSFKPAIKRAVAGSLPASVNVDTVEVTKIREATKDRKIERRLGRGPRSPTEGRRSALRR